MKQWMALFLAGCLVSGVAFATVDEFNTAWRAYRAAVADADLVAELSTSADVVELGRNLFDADDERIPALINNHAAALLKNGHVQQANALFNEAFQQAKRIHGKNAEPLLVLTLARADLLDAAHEWDTAHRWYKESLRLARKVYPTDSLEFANAALQLGPELAKRSPSMGVSLLKEAAEIFEANAATSDVGVTSFYIGRIELARGNRQRALKAFEESLTQLDTSVPLAKARSLAARAALVPLYERRGDSEKATEHCVAIGRDSKFTDDQDYLPLYRMAPTYPPAMLRARIEGYVDLEFTVDESGIVRDVEATQVVHTGQKKGAESIGTATQLSRKQRQFADAARAAVERFRYAPRFVDGRAVATPGVDSRISFEIEE
ncbi:MAG: tetratricopeptide repeat protein [Pseudomonadota bacterium]